MLNKRRHPVNEKNLDKCSFISFTKGENFDWVKKKLSNFIILIKYKLYYGRNMAQLKHVVYFMLC